MPAGSAGPSAKLTRQERFGDAEAILRQSAAADRAAYVLEQRICSARDRFGIRHLITIWMLHDQNTAHDKGRLEHDRRRNLRSGDIVRLYRASHRAAVDA